MQCKRNVEQSKNNSELFCCTLETNTTLQSNYTPIKMGKKRLKKIVQLKSKRPCSSLRDIHNSLSFNSYEGTKAVTQVEDGNFRCRR